MKKIEKLSKFISIILPIVVIVISFIYTLSLVPTQLVFGFDQA